MPLGRLSLLLGVAIACVGCSSYRLVVDNVDRGPVRVVVNGRELGRLTCFDHPLVVTSATSGLLPWHVEIVDEATGQRTGPQTFKGDWPQQTLLVREIGLIPVPPAHPVTAELPRDHECPEVSPELLPTGAGDRSGRLPLINRQVTFANIE